MSDSVQPHRRQPTRLPRPWDSPAKNTGVGCHFLLQCKDTWKIMDIINIVLKTVVRGQHKVETQKKKKKPCSCPKNELPAVSCCLVIQLHLTLWPYGLYPSRLLCPWDTPGKNTGVGCYFLLWGIFLTQESNTHLLQLLNCRRILYHWATREALGHGLTILVLLYMCGVIK